MPVLVDRGPGGCTIAGGQGTPARRAAGAPASGRLRMDRDRARQQHAGAALEATEQQFLELLGAAAGDSWVHLRFFSLPGVAAQRARPQLSQPILCRCDRYPRSRARRPDRDRHRAQGAAPHGRAVLAGVHRSWSTGPRTTPISTVWSCLAAHAAVLHLDGIERAPLPEKRIGVFDCDRLARASAHCRACRRARRCRTRAGTS